MVLQPIRDRFWAWYERHYLLNTCIAGGLFLLQLVHLYWLTAHVVLGRLMGTSFFNPSLTWQFLLVIVDYTEIPALLGASLLYMHDIKKKFRWRSVLFLFFLNTQWLHLFWITDEFVVNSFRGVPSATVLPVWLAWVAILIDYLELPVIVDTVRRIVIAVHKEGVPQLLAKASKYYVWKRGDRN